MQYVKNGVRKLVWERIQFRENPIRAHDAPLGQAFEDAVWELLRHEEMRPLQVRFGVWREGVDGMKFVCKVELRTPPSTASCRGAGGRRSCARRRTWRPSWTRPCRPAAQA